MRERISVTPPSLDYGALENWPPPLHLTHGSAALVLAGCSRWSDREAGVGRRGVDVPTGPNPELEDDFVAWRSRCVRLLRELGPDSGHLLRGLGSDTRGVLQKEILLS